MRLYTDGACQTSTGKGGWAYALVAGDRVIRSKSNHVRRTTNNQMELRAVIEAIRSTGDFDGELEIVTDSQYVIKGITQWIHSWKAKGWIGSNRKPVANQDLWKELDTLYDPQRMRLTWVKGHSGNGYNTLVDKLAVKASKGTVTALPAIT